MTNCINLKCRSKHYQKYFICTLSKELNPMCKGCLNKRYKEVKPMKHLSSKRAKSCDIPKKVKEIVNKRDGGICVICKIRIGQPNMHYIPRSKNGLGIEQNIVCGCEICHDEYDKSILREQHRETIKKHLKSKYENWNEEKLTYKKR